MKAKKIFGIILSVVFAVLFLGGSFCAVFVSLLWRGYDLLICILLGILPLVAPAIILGVLYFIFYLLDDQ